ncbi:MAG TPA: Rieske (2Fe-2S) protein [Streptosporangiaceae bacterium]|nr:Rieske (2Fe-2S) protein [Streptosporangiaceae bacterium]
MSGPLSDRDLADGCLTCPWHGSVLRIRDGSVVHGPPPRRSRPSTRA